jgi:hypothetical protein
MDGWLSVSIYLSAAILLFSMLGCLPDVISLIVNWLLPERPSALLGVLSGTASSLVVSCEILMAFSGAYLVVALLIKSHTRQSASGALN